jgi:hypothetical protein
MDSIEAEEAAIGARAEDYCRSEVEGISPMLYLPPSRLYQELEILQTIHTPQKRRNSEHLYQEALLAEALWAQQSEAPQSTGGPRFGFTPTLTSRGSRSPENV